MASKTTVKCGKTIGLTGLTYLLIKSTEDSYKTVNIMNKQTCSRI